MASEGKVRKGLYIEEDLLEQMDYYWSRQM